MRKAMTTMQIISMVIVLVVVAVLVFVVAVKLGYFNTNITSCQSRGGTCVKEVADCDQSISYFDCPKEAPICCIGS
jgi:competence protein ComGC